MTHSQPKNQNYSSFDHLLPPRNLEAEESILSAILIDSSTLLDVVEILSPEDFYNSKHQKIFDAVLELFRKNEPVDTVTLLNILRERGHLDDIGGVSYLARLIDEVPLAVNAPYYAKIIRDKACLRRMIEKAEIIRKRCFEDRGDVDDVIDFAERSIFEVSESKINATFYPLSKIINDNIDALEKRQENRALVTGIPTGFAELDKMTAGFQKSDLIILAARPSMGKCCEAATEIVLADGSISTIGEIYRRRQARMLTLNDTMKFHFTEPSDFVDDGKKPVFRVTTGLGRFVETTLTHPFLTLQGWKPLSELAVGNKIALPRKIAVFGTEAMRECEVKLLAYLIGDGNLTNACPRFTNKNPRILADFISAANEFGGIKATVSESPDRCPEIRIASCYNFEENRSIFGQLLQDGILCKNLSNNRFAKQIGVSPASVHGWVNGKYAPSPVLLDVICNFFETDPEQLISGRYASVAKNSKNVLTLWLESLGIQGKNSHAKFIPEAIFKLPRHQLVLFLNRLFATDGWACVLNSGQAQLGYGSVSEKLIRQLQHLLLRFGIIGKIRKRQASCAGKYFPAWQLDITDAESISIFIEEIGIFGKEESLEKVKAAFISKKYKPNTDLIPIEIWEFLAEAKASESWSQLAKRAGIIGYTNIHAGKRAMPRKRLAALADALNNKKLQQLAQSEIYWDEIVSIEAVGEKQVYDLTIPVTHNFVANDICVHNTALALNIARNAAVNAEVPVAVFSLEMSKEQLSMRMLCAEARVDSSRVRSGYFSHEDWIKLTEAAGNLSEMPIYIDDSASISDMEIRAKARRLKMDKKLGLIIIDYLQLMRGRSTAERRDLEIAEISRSLKALAKELDLPVIALSQLNRKLEERGDKRPILSDLRESGCLAGDTLILLSDGRYVPIKTLVEQQSINAEIFAINERNLKIEPIAVRNAFSTGIKPVFRLETSSGRTLKATANHKFRTLTEWKRLDQLKIGEHIAVPRCLKTLAEQTMKECEAALLGHLIGDGCTLPRHSIQYTTREKDLAEMVAGFASGLFLSDIMPRIKKERTWYQVYLTSNRHLTHRVRNPISEWLTGLDIFGLRSHEKRVPEKIFIQPEKIVSCFLRHLWTTDGSITVRMNNRGKLAPSIYYASSSFRLVYDVSSLLLRFGINAVIKKYSQHHKGRDQYHVMIMGKSDIEKFATKIGTAGDYKKERLEKIKIVLSDTLENTNRDVIPKEAWKTYVVPSMQAHGISTRKMQAKVGNLYCGTSLYKNNMSRKRAKRVALAVNSVELELLSDSDIYWDKIQKIEYAGEEETFDLTVPFHHNFIANNILVHNSLEQDADLVAFIYRDEVYNKDENNPNKGLAELIVAKQRNGPVGTVMLTFINKYTRFENPAI
ncbi:MAG: replicative DNA helicase [Desulfobacteraceae bacterium IS3]|nr:MAG: replicative DNA helicase [Desulfobacteraceae bacterium IS3]